MCKKTQEEIEVVKKLYLEGNSIREIHCITNWAQVTIGNAIKEIVRTRSEANLLANKMGKCNLSEEGRLKLIKSGINSIKRNKKYWTEPEIEFKKILNEIGIGVAFPNFCKLEFDLVDDPNAEVCFQYPIQRYVCDFVDVNRKIVYCVDGDFWHANPILYKKLSKVQEFNSIRDQNRKIFLEKNGYIVCNVWESEINWNKELVKRKIWATRKMANPPDLHSGNTAFESLVAYSDWSEDLKKMWFKERKNVKPKILSTKYCNFCGNLFEGKEKRKFCSQRCCKLKIRRVNRQSYEELKLNLSKMSMVAVGKKYGVSDKSIKKWILNYEKCV